LRAAVAICLASLPTVAAAEPCAHFDLLPGAGVDLSLVSALRDRVARSGLASTGDLADCPVRLAASGEEVDVTVELEDRVVVRTFPGDPPREAAWAIALLLEELAGAEARHGPETPPPEEIIPTVGLPVAPPDLTPGPRVERRVRPTRRTNLRLALGVRALGGIRYKNPNASVERAAASVDAALAPSFLPRWLAVAAFVEWYLPRRQQGVTFQSLQIAVGPDFSFVHVGPLSGTADLALLMLRKDWVEGGPPGASAARGPGVLARVRAEYRLLPGLGIAAGFAAVWIPQTHVLDCVDPSACRRDSDLYTTPWDFGAGIDVMIHL